VNQENDKQAADAEATETESPDKVAPDEEAIDTEAGDEEANDKEAPDGEVDDEEINDVDAAGKGSAAGEVMPGGGGQAFFSWIFVAAMVVALDQATKWMIIKWVPLYEKVPLNGFINITHQRNTGAAFSFLAGASGWQRYFFIGLASVVSAYIIYWLWSTRRDGQFVVSAGLALVLGGAIGNVIDRMVLGSVVDFIQVLIAGWPFPSFNVADSAITVGAILLIVDALFLSGSGDRK
jgi:signal peptidase II